MNMVYILQHGQILQRLKPKKQGQKKSDILGIQADKCFTETKTKNDVY